MERSPIAARSIALPPGHVQPGALVRGALAHVGKSIGAEHIDRARHGLIVAPLTGHERDSGGDLIADLQDESDAPSIIEYPHPLSVS